ncbi:VOC family protein [Streptomyces sp. DH12]|uniref:VOC family protein n=1 Tax=Streptomyces sp. DH12 TaxID=2857010 RepID=UPI001E45630C|nr:VOC family protein [Streptomyces sp. DH12]
MNWTLEVVNLPVSDLDRAKEFYADRCGFHVDVDTEVAPGVRVIQLTPPGSRCSIALQSGMPPAPDQHHPAPGTVHGLQLCVVDIEAAREELASRGVEVGPIRHLGPGGWAEGKGGTWNAWAFFRDPDGNGWAVQEVPSELTDR